jgi:hypothetical protein
MSKTNEKKIFSIYDSTSVLTNNTLEKNILHLEKHYGEKFIIKCGSIQLPIILHKKKGSYKIIYQLMYDYGHRRYESILPLIVDIDPANSIAYIANVHREESSNVSGSDIVVLCLNFLKVIGVEFVYLSDDSHLECKDPQGHLTNEVSLSLFKLIEKGRTFYQKFGFKLYDIPREIAMYYGSEKRAQGKLLQYVEKFRKIKVSDVINLCVNTLTLLFHVLKKQDYENIEFIISRNVHVKPEKKKEKSESTIEEINYILNSLLQTEYKYLYEYLIFIFNTDCARYLRLEELIFFNLLEMIRYKNKRVRFMYREITQHIIMIMKNCKYAMYLKDFEFGCE